ncbi:unnamed protein product [Adineta steineri]|uniref:Uncharacterized protein n=1 Tax=Adineta steineri TaxID=433720 RepID=A0A814I0W6_9BILA|nr:unnamed protein product [Adineta steineri]CAF3681514.1 unnamed protein product [Adineta steineri]
MNICDESMKFSQFDNELFSSKDFLYDIFMDNNQCESSNYEQILNMIDTPPSNLQSINKEIITFISVTHGAMDVNALARCIMSEASTGNRNEQIAIGFACQRNRNHASNQPPTYNVTKLAQDILARKINDTTNGANHWYSPRSMPNETQRFRCKKPIGTGHMDCNGGLEKSCEKSRNYKPGWAKNRNPVYIPNVRDCYFKFFLL